MKPLDDAAGYREEGHTTCRAGLIVDWLIGPLLAVRVTVACDHAQPALRARAPMAWNPLSGAGCFLWSCPHTIN